MDKFSNQITQSKAERAIRLSEEYNAKKLVLDNTNRILDKFETMIPSLNAALSKVHLSLESFRFSKTGCGSDDKTWKEDDAIHFSLNLATTNKFKFIKFDGYTKSGSGRNHNRLVEKQEKLEQHIFENCGLELRINCYSLEIDTFRRNESPINKTVLAEFWLK